MSHDKVFSLIAQVPLMVAVLYLTLIDLKNHRAPLIVGWRRATGWVVYYALLFGWFAGMLGAFSWYFGVPDGLAWSYFGAAVLVQAILQRSKEVSGGATR